MQVPLHIVTFSLDPRDGCAVLLLEHADTARLFPLWLDDGEAASIARALEGREGPRPDPGDLMLGMLLGLGARVRDVAITRVVQGVVHAQLALLHAGHDLILDARPSDALGIAVRAAAPIFIDDGLLEQVAARVREAEARVRPTLAATGAEPVHQSQAERWNQLISHLSSSGEYGDLFEA